MTTVTVLRNLPSNLEAFVDEVSEGFTLVYGEPAAQSYRAAAVDIFEGNLENPDVLAFSAGNGPVSDALLLAHIRNNVGYIPFIHVLGPAHGLGIERLLLAAAIPALKARGVSGIVAESLSFCPLDWEEVFLSFGFTHYSRCLMATESRALASAAAPVAASRPLVLADAARAAALLVEAYTAHPGRPLHPEVQTISAARELVRGVITARFGNVQPGFSRCVEVEGALAGISLGSEAVEGVGFVLQIVTAPQFRGMGLATAMLVDQAAAIAKAGIDRIALGVTRTNPAYNLYRRLGFAEIHPVDAYVWWQPGAVGYTALTESKNAGASHGTR